MPYKMVKVANHDEVRQDIAHPIRDKCRQYIETKVLDAYEDVLTEMQTDTYKLPMKITKDMGVGFTGTISTIDRDRGRNAEPIGL